MVEAGWSLSRYEIVDADHAPAISIGIREVLFPHGAVKIDSVFVNSFDAVRCLEIFAGESRAVVITRLEFAGGFDRRWNFTHDMMAVRGNLDQF